MTMTQDDLRRSVSCWAAAALLLVAGTAGAGQEGGGVAINIGSAEGSPGTSVVVGVTVRGPAAAKVTAFEQDVRFDSRVLTFDTTEVSPLGKAAGVTVTMSAEADAADKNYSFVRLKATSERPMSGPVLGVMFRIKEDVKGGTKTALTGKARVAKPGGTALAEVGGKDGEVEVTAEAVVFGCFFYMH